MADAAVYMWETFHGFVATTIDAAYLVQAAALANPRILPLLPRMPNSESELARLIRPGSVLVCPVWDNQHWNDGRTWAKSNVLGNAFSIHREMTDDPDLQVTQEDLAQEHVIKQRLAPYLDGHVGREGSRKDGLIKRIVRFTLGGQMYILVAYYTMACLPSLVRPRQMVVGQSLLALELSEEFWHQPGHGKQRILMRDDQPQGAVSNWESWYNAPKVELQSYRGVGG